MENWGKNESESKMRENVNNTIPSRASSHKMRWERACVLVLQNGEELVANPVVASWNFLGIGICF